MPGAANQPPGDGVFSRVIRIRDVGAAGESYEITATGAERAAIAGLFKIPAIGALHGRFLLQPQGMDRIVATLHLAAKVTRTCVVSLEEFEAQIEEEVPVIFVSADHIIPFDDDPESPDEIPFDGSTIDLGIALTEQLALALDPYPRKPDVVVPEELSTARENPFALFFDQVQKKGKPGPRES
jgi:hypothetical protein